ncbi:MAG TPA: hypothetical protein VFS71_11195 [Flavobacterium sp.]|uniref:hypothetical protein n=1 Tax=Flavobacterium sp. TaxID=239 RepID=UPI002DB7EF1A|nr:hypothetical protein [Flavobacterium sp.]HEU4790243.1 hypothetical protein [Flavobacterium sp.]
MKNFRLKSILAIVLLTTVFVSCNNDDDEQVNTSKTKVALVTKIEGPTTGKVNVELSYVITYIVDNACAEFVNITETTIDKEIGYQVEVKYPAEVCTQQVPDPKKTLLKFTPTVKGTFELKFKKSETEFVTQKVVIE